MGRKSVDFFEKLDVTTYNLSLTTIGDTVIMNTVKLITRLLPSRAPLQYQDPVFKNSKLTKADIAMALAHAPDVSYKLVSWFLLQDKTMWHPLLLSATQQMHTLATDKQWPMAKKPEQLKLFTQTVLLEWANINQCQPCKDSGIVNAVKHVNSVTGVAS